MVNLANLEALGARRLAELLLELGIEDAGIKRRLRLELSAEAGTEAIAGAICKRLTALRQGRSFVVVAECPDIPIRQPSDPQRYLASFAARVARKDVIAVSPRRCNEIRLYGELRPRHRNLDAGSILSAPAGLPRCSRCG